MSAIGSEPTAGTVPVHHQIADAIRHQIESGELQPGDSLPSVRALQEQWACSALTIRSAISVLRTEGQITSTRGKRPTVREPQAKQQINLTSSWADEQKGLVLLPQEERAKRGAIEMVSGIPIDQVYSTHHYDEIAATADLAREFSITEGSDLQRRTYEMTDKQSGHRLSYSVSYIPLHLISGNPDLLDENNEPWPGGHQHQLYTVGIEIDRFVRTITAAQPTPGEQQKWAIEAGVPMLLVRSRSIDTTGQVVELSDATYPADRTEIEFREQLTPWPNNHKRYELNEGN